MNGGGQMNGGGLGSNDKRFATPAGKNPHMAAIYIKKKGNKTKKQSKE
jgi:hypothetical protein